MASNNFQFSLGLKQVLKGKAEGLVNKIKVVMDNQMDEVEKLFRTKVSEGGYSAYDELRHTYKGVNRDKPHHYTKWKVTPRHSSVSLNYEIRNRSPHAVYLYTSKKSHGHDDGFRSAYPHDDKRRANQVTKAKMGKTMSKIRARMFRSIRKLDKTASKTTSTYKG